jgi:hypothetical protein
MIKTTLMLAALAVAPQGDDFKREQGTALLAMEGKPAPALQVSDWRNADDGGMTLSGLRGKVVVLDFWGTW